MATRRLYYDDATLRQFDAQVLTCEPLPDDGGLGALPGKAWAVTLDQTAFYPTSGGQPNDLGRLGEAQVLDVRDDGDHVVHLIDRPLAEGPVSGLIDWPRRFDHMQQHTGQHLLSAVLQARFGLPTVSFHLGVSVSTVDLRGAEPSSETLDSSERAANEIIFGDRPVTIRYGTAEELAKIGVRKQVERKGVLRAIEIAGIDLQPCGGTHVSATGQIGMLLIRRCTKIRQDWRVEFVCGGRAERSAGVDRDLVRGAAELLKCAEEDVAKSVQRAIADRDAQFKALRGATERLAEAEARLVLPQIVPSRNGFKIVARVLEGVEPIYLAKFATSVAQNEGTVALLARKECGHIAFAQHPSVGKDMNALLKSVLQEMGGKGGGTRDFARGALANNSGANAAIDLARKLVEGER